MADFTVTPGEVVPDNVESIPGSTGSNALQRVLIIIYELT